MIFLDKTYFYLMAVSFLFSTIQLIYLYKNNILSRFRLLYHSIILLLHSALIFINIAILLIDVQKWKEILTANNEFLLSLEILPLIFIALSSITSLIFVTIGSSMLNQAMNIRVNIK